MSLPSLSSPTDDSFFVLGKKVRLPSYLVVVIALMVLWELVCRIFQIPKWFLPPLSLVLRTFIEQYPLLLHHTWITLLEAMSGFGIAIVLSIALALLVDGSSFLRKILYPLMIISQTIPIITIAPLLVIWLGFGIGPKIVIVVLICFFPISMSLIQSLSQVDQDYIALMKTMKANQHQIFFHLKIPSMLPSFFSGLKISATYSIMGAVIAEWLGAKAGLGEYMRRTLHTFSTERVFCAILIIIGLSLLLVGVIRKLELLALPWMYSTSKNRLSNKEVME